MSDAFEVYTSILHKIEDDVKDMLGCNGPDWRVLNACPPCSYEVGSLAQYPHIETDIEFIA